MSPFERIVLNAHKIPDRVAWRKSGLNFDEYNKLKNGDVLFITRYQKECIALKFGLTRTEYNQIFNPTKFKQQKGKQIHTAKSKVLKAVDLSNKGYDVPQIMELLGVKTSDECCFRYAIRSGCKNYGVVIPDIFKKKHNTDNQKLIILRNCLLEGKSYKDATIIAGYQQKHINSNKYNFRHSFTIRGWDIPDQLKTEQQLSKEVDNKR